MWLWRAYGNVDAVAPGVRRYDRGWAIGAWFVPILNLFRPKQIVNDVWRAGGPPPEPSFLLASWWTAWLVTNWIGNFALRNAFEGDAPRELRGGSIAYAVGSGMDVVAAILAIFVAITLTRRLDAQAAAGPPPQWPPPQGRRQPSGRRRPARVRRLRLR